MLEFAAEQKAQSEKPRGLDRVLVVAHEELDHPVDLRNHLIDENHMGILMEDHSA